MHPTTLIARHLDRANLKIPVLPVPEGTICSFTGKPISEGVANKDLIKKTFTDLQHIRFPSEYSSVDIALCMEEVLLKESDGKAVANSLRSFSYFATENEFRLLEKSSVLESLFFNLPDEPFVFCITYSHKKHTAYKAAVNLNGQEFTVTTDEGNVFVEREKARAILRKIGAWYTVTPESRGKAQESTYFTKDEIREGNAGVNKILRYGLARYKTENQEIEKFRGTPLLELLTTLLQKQYAEI